MNNGGTPFFYDHAKTCISSIIRQTGEYQNGCYKKTKQCKYSGKATFLTPWYVYVSCNTRFENCPFAILLKIYYFSLAKKNSFKQKVKDTVLSLLRFIRGKKIKQTAKVFSSSAKIVATSYPSSGPWTKASGTMSFLLSTIASLDSRPFLAWKKIYAQLKTHTMRIKLGRFHLIAVSASSFILL